LPPITSTPGHPARKSAGNSETFCVLPSLGSEMHMRPNLHLITEHRSRRHRAARRAARRAAPGRLRNAVESAVAPRAFREATSPGTQELREDLQVPDVALRRVRESGGPLDHASYVCECGYVFEADVSTTVSCPHCSAPQAW
jgi:rubrerythrin